MSEKRILIVDDDESVCKLCEDILESEGYVSDSCFTGTDAIRMASARVYDIVLMDLKLPDIEGMVLLMEIKKKNKGASVIIITAYGDMKSVLEAMRAGAHDYLTKPFQQEDLTIAVKRCLDRQSLSNEVNELRKINALYRISKAMSSEMELEKLLRLIMQSAIATLHADSGSLMLVDKNKKTMTIKTSAGMEGKKIESQKIRIGEGISGWVAAKGKPLLLIEDMKDYPQFSSLKIRKEIKSAICVPMKIKDAVTGVLSINNVKSENIYTDDDMKILTILAGDAALAIHNASLLETTREQFTQLKQKIAVKGENRCPKKRKR